MSSNRIIAVLLVLGILVAFAVYHFMQPSTIPTISRTSESEPTTGKPEIVSVVKTDESGTVDQPAPAEPKPLDLGLTTEQLFEGLFRALDANDKYAADKLLEQLQNSNKPDVIPTAKKHFTTTSLEPKKRPYVGSLFHYCMLRLFAADDPEYALTNVRNDWGMGGLSDEVSTGWENFQLHQVDRHASMFRKSSGFSKSNRILLSLSPAYISADALAMLTVLKMVSGSGESLAVLKWLRNNYSRVREKDELPDPWLSYLISKIGQYQAKGSDTQKAEIILFLTWIVETDRFSDRLIAQAEILLQTDPNSFWEMMDLLATAKGPKAAGKALMGLLATRALTAEELRQFIEAFQSRFGSDVSSYRKMAHMLLSASETLVPIEHFQSLALDAVGNALVAEEGMIKPYADLLFAMKGNWSKSRSGKELFTLKDHVDIDDMFKLLRRTSKLKDSDLTGLKVLELFWLTDRSLSEKIVDYTKAAGRSKRIYFWSALNALERGRKDLHESDAENVVALLNLITTKSAEFNKLISKRTERSFADAFHTRVSVRQLSVIFEATNYPRIPQALKDTLALLIAAYQSDTASGLSSKPSETIEHSIVLADKYELNVGTKGD